MPDSTTTTPRPEPKPVSEWSKEEQGIHKTGVAARDFLRSEFGKFRQAVLQKQIDAKRNEFELPPEVQLDGMAQALRDAANKGAILGLRLALSLELGMVAQMQELRASKGLPPLGDEE